MAIIIVLAAHASGTLPFIKRKDIYAVTGDLGPLGVNLFFVISGFLISTILFRDQASYGKPHLLRFYFRRAFRILPAFLLFLFTMLLAQAVGVINVPLTDWLCAFTYTINYHWPREWTLTHCWSLAVEEQFYLLWPAVLWFWGRKRSLFGVGVIVALLPVVRAFEARFFPGHRSSIPWEFHTTCDGLAVGCLLAGIRGQLAAWRPYSRFRRTQFAYVALAAGFLVSGVSYHLALFRYTFGPTFVSLCWAWFLDVTMLNPQTSLGRALNSRPFVYIGILSYSLYLWQQPFLHRGPHLLLSFPVNLVCAFAAAILSYYAVERPFLRLRARLEAVTGSGSIATEKSTLQLPSAAQRH